MNHGEILLPIYGLGAYKLQLSPYLPQFTEVRKSERISFRERWIEPMLHPVTIPFEPWVCVRIVTVKERAIYYMGTTILTHPGNHDFIKSKMGRM